MTTNWVCKKFGELTAEELYAILRLRSEVFVVEQNCVFLDMDNKDQYCDHLAGWQGDKLVGYARIVPAGISYSESSIGRVVSSPSTRKTGMGKKLMKESIEQIRNLFHTDTIRIGAQLYLQKFYESFGFTRDGEIYLEDNIPHILMLKEPK